MIRAGKLRHRVNLVRKGATQNTYGEEVVTWTTDKEVWASRRALRGDEYFSARQIQSNVTHEIRIRHTTLSASTKIRPSNCRIEFIRDGTMFNILSAFDPNGRKINIDIMANESS